jgi:hypothetical protein
MTHSRVASPATRSAGRVLHVLGPLFYLVNLILSPLRLLPRGELLGEWWNSVHDWTIAFNRNHAVVEQVGDVPKSGCYRTDALARTVTVDIEGLQTTYRYEVAGKTLSLTQSLSGAVNTFTR